MAKLYFRWGCMGSSKTANALMVAFNYEEKGLRPLVVKPILDARDGKRVLRSRIGLIRICGYVEDYISTDVEKTFENVKTYDAIIVDEVQFLNPELIYTFQAIAHDLDIPIMCYGLRDDFKTVMFPASSVLWEVADEIEEMRTVCWCGKGARYNARLDDDGNVVREGDSFLLGGSDRYTSLCEEHYWSGDVGRKSVYGETTLQKEGEVDNDCEIIHLNLDH